MNFLPLCAVLALIGLSTTSGHAETVTKTVPSNRSSVVGSFGGFERHTCRSIGLPDAVIRQRPAHGELRIEHQRAKSSSALCAGTEQQFLVFVYSPRKGFKGSDAMTIDIPWRNHDHAPMSYLTYDFTITVN